MQGADGRKPTFNMRMSGYPQDESKCGFHALMYISCTFGSLQCAHGMAAHTGEAACHYMLCITHIACAFKLAAVDVPAADHRHLRGVCITVMSVESVLEHNSEGL